MLSILQELYKKRIKKNAYICTLLVAYVIIQRSKFRLVKAGITRIKFDLSKP